MKLTKFGTITEKDGDFLFDCFSFDAEGETATPTNCMQCIIDKLQTELDIGACNVDCFYKDNSFTDTDGNELIIEPKVEG